MDTTPLAPSPSPPSFVMQRKIRFGDTDPAGIVFYPRYFEMLNETMEDFCEDALGLSFRRMHGDLRMGIPLLRVTSEFMAPSRLGDLVRFELTLLEFGRTSFAVQIEALAETELRLRARLLPVFMSLDTGRPVPPPADVAERLRGLLR